MPFYHGALVHLDTTYIKKNGPGHGRSGAHLFAFAVLFVEGCLLVSAAFLSCHRKSTPFAVMIAALLTVDILWALVTHLWVGTANNKWDTEIRWALINFVSLVVLIAALLFSYSHGLTDLWLAGGLLLGSFARTVCDYGFCWGSYYPAIKKSQRQKKSAKRLTVQKETIAA